MKKNKIIFLLITLFLFLPNVYAEKITVTLDKCVDGDTAKFKKNNKTITARFLAIDTPETKHPKKGEEPYGKEASNFTCNTLKRANKIEIEYDGNKQDKYDRHLVWVFTDDTLLQDEIIKKGYAKVAYLYDDYKYTKTLQDHEKIAKKEKTRNLGRIQNKLLVYHNNNRFFNYNIHIWNQKNKKKNTKQSKKKSKKRNTKSIINYNLCKSFFALFYFPLSTFYNY